MSFDRADLAAAGTLLLASGVLQAVGDTVYALDRVAPGEPGFAFANLVAMTWHIFMGLGVAGLARVFWPVLGVGGRIGAALAITGILLLVAAELSTQLMSAVPVPLIAASAPVTGIGAILLGVAIVRGDPTHRTTGAAMALVGVFALAVIVPTSVGPGGANYFVIAGWGLCWATVGACALVRVRKRRSPQSRPEPMAERGAEPVVAG